VDAPNDGLYQISVKAKADPRAADPARTVPHVRFLKDEITMTRTELAEYVGASLETVVRVLKQPERRKTW